MSKASRISKRELQINELLQFCQTPRSRKEMMNHLGLNDVKGFRSNYLIPMQNNGLIAMLNPDMPTWRHQKYIASDHVLVSAKDKN